MKHLITALFIFTLLTSALQSHAASPPAPVPQTGQTLCYNSSGEVIPCAGTGQDGDLKMGVVWPSPRFLDNGDQTVTDKLTGLIWAKDANLMKTRDPSFDADYAPVFSWESSNDGAVTWQHALNYIKKLNAENYQGHNDWRLPNINELKSLVNQGQSYPATWLNGQGFSNVQSGYYRSSSSYAGSTESAWVVDVYGGGLGIFNKAYNYYVWPVRGGLSGSFGNLTLAKTGQTTCYDTSGTVISCSGTGQDGELQVGAVWPIPRFTANADQTVTDNLTGLIWSRDANPATWQQALDYIKTLNSSSYLGHNDWRLPNRNELESLVNRGQANGGTWLNGQGFSNVGSDFYWSGSTVASSTNLVWGVNVGHSYASGLNKSGYPNYVWPVRSGQSGTITKPGDCDNSGTVTISEVQSAINMFLGLKQPASCVDEDLSGTVSISEVQKTINAFLGLIPAASTYSISGTVTTNGTALAEVTVNTTGGSATTDASGNYTISGLANGAYTITAGKTGYTFAPVSRTVTVSGANMPGNNFTATATTSSSTTLTDPTTGMVLVKVTGGTYTMGDTFGSGFISEQPSHQVIVSDFYIGKYEVTQEQWQAVMGTNPSNFAACGTTCPVEQVSWDGIQTFITKLNQQSGKNYRLPTEAEWEYAARSGGKREKYSGSNDVSAVAWYYGNSAVTYNTGSYLGLGTHPVGQQQANGLSLYDMSGNVAEWVNDWDGAYSNAAQTNPTGPSAGSSRVIRGGGWFEDANGVRASYRASGAPYGRSIHVGFRLAAPVQ
jgi:formylglycine-generating enzyme required for sulfatase activity